MGTSSRGNERAKAAGFKSAKEVTEYIKEANNGSSPSFHIRPEYYNLKNAEGIRYGAAGIAAMHYNATKSELGFAGMSKYSKSGRVRGHLPRAVRDWYVNIAKIYTSGEWDQKYGKPTR